MTDPTPDQPSEQADLITQLRDEMNAQITALKESFESQNKQLSDENATLKQQNIDLQRALVRSATVPDEHHVVQPKSEQQIYEERIKELADKALQKVII
jgi:small-conductance mechanosensitive channel